MPVLPSNGTDGDPLKGIAWFILFFFVWLFRYARFIVNCISSYTYQTSYLPLHPKFSSANVTVIIPTTLGEGEHLVDTISSIMACFPKQIILTTSSFNIPAAKLLCKINGFSDVRVLGVPKMGKRLQMIRGLRDVQTEITVFADDDVIWPRGFLSHLLAAFDDPRVGAAGTLQRVIRQANPSLFNFLGISYLERRNFLNCATNHIDGGLSTLSGRTAAYRTQVLQNDTFYELFQNERWFGKRLNTDDDKFLTRWMYSNGWQIRLHKSQEAIIYTTLEDGPKYFSQCIRWARSHWRGNLSVIVNHAYWYKVHRYSCYSIYVASFQTPALAVDSLLFWLMSKALEAHFMKFTGLSCLAAWIILTKTAKLIPHFRRHPEDLKFVPASILFGYLHGFINIYALCTLHVTSWGSRVVADELETPPPSSPDFPISPSNRFSRAASNHTYPSGRRSAEVTGINTDYGTECLRHGFASLK